MAKNFKQKGLSFLECLIALALCQVLIWGCYPSFMTLIQQNQSFKLLNQLQTSIDWARWMAVIRHEKLIIEPIGQWQHGWRIFANQKLIKEVKGVGTEHISLQWHGFTGNGHLTFYPKMVSNHLNGYFQMGHHQLWINRLGHMRVTDGL